MNNGLVNIQPDHTGWMVRDVESFELLAAYNYDPYMKVWYGRLHVEFEVAQDGFYYITGVAFESVIEQCKHILDAFYEDNDIDETQKELRKRIERDACYPFLNYHQGAGREGQWIVRKLHAYFTLVAESRLPLLQEPPIGMRQWSQHDNQVLSEDYRADAWWDAMGLDK